MANIPTTAWDETSPAGSQAVSLGDDRIREGKTQVREVIGVDHKFGSSGNDADNGKHNKISLLEQADLGTGASGKPLLGAQTDAASNPELCYTGEDDVDLFITKGGKILLDNGRLSNNTNLIARNAAGSGNVSIIKVNASDVVEIPVTAVLSSSAAPTSDPQISNKKYVDDKVAAVPAQVGFGTIASKSIGTTYQAATDGIVIASCASDGGGNGYLQGKTDSANPPTTVVAKQLFNNVLNSVGGHVCFPVKKNNYYLVEASNGGNSQIMYFTPLGS